MMTDTLSLIVCTYRRPEAMADLLAALEAQTRKPDQTLIVDGSPDDETRTVVEAVRGVGSLPGLVYVDVPPERRGLTRQRNDGIERATGAVVAFLDDDTVPEPDYFEQVMACFRRHPEALGVGGYLTNEVAWTRVDPEARASAAAYRFGAWERRLDYRHRVRGLLRLDSPLSPGRIPPSGHALPGGFIPPDGRDHPVEFIIGASMAWRREVVERHAFSAYFEGYGLYEDLEYCIRVVREGPIYLCTRARAAHYHAPGGRPNSFRYGEMVVRNGWLVWRKRWAAPGWRDRLRWWATTGLLALCRLGDAVRGPRRRQAFTEAAGRLWGMASVLIAEPVDPSRTECRSVA